MEEIKRDIAARERQPCPRAHSQLRVKVPVNNLINCAVIRVRSGPWTTADLLLYPPRFQCREQRLSVPHSATRHSIGTRIPLQVTKLIVSID